MTERGEEIASRRKNVATLRDGKGRAGRGVRLRFGRGRTGVIGGVGLALLCALALAVPWLTPYEYARIDLEISGQGPSLEHPMGTDVLGRDELTRVLYGGRVSLQLALSAGAISAVVGAAVGFVSGYYGRLLDAGFMGLADLALMLPLLPVVLVAGSIFGFSQLTVTLVLALSLWPGMARQIRAQVLFARSREYVEAAKALGVTDIRVMSRHLLPNMAGTLAVEATLLVAAAILAESALSYLSVFMCDINPNCFLSPGVKSGIDSWGRMLGESRTTMTSQWWLTVFPGAMISVTILCVNFLGDGLRDAFDPRSGE